MASMTVSSVTARPMSSVVATASPSTTAADVPTVNQAARRQLRGGVTEAGTLPRSNFRNPVAVVSASVCTTARLLTSPMGTVSNTMSAEMSLRLGGAACRAPVSWRAGATGAGRSCRPLGSSPGQAGSGATAWAGNAGLTSAARRAVGTAGTSGSTGHPGRRVSTSLTSHGGVVSIGRGGTKPPRLACAGALSVGRTAGVHAAPVAPCRCRP